MWGRRILKMVGVLAAAFVLTSALMFWLPRLANITGYDTYDYIDVYADQYGYGDYSTPIGRLKKLSPQDEWQALDAIATRLDEKTDAELYKLKAAPDVCVTEIVDCDGLPDAKVRPVIDAVLATHQTAETVAYYRRTGFITSGSLFVSFLALLISGLTFRRGRRQF
jgi:hypothetical protein